MKIWMLIWDYWPGVEGGSERQARMVAQHLLKNRVDCQVLTSWSQYSLPRSGKDGLLQVHRLGVLAPLRLMGQRVAGFILDFAAKFFPIFRKPSGDNIFGALQFWLALPWCWLARLSFMVEVAVWYFFKGKDVQVIHLHEPSWLGGFAQLISKVHNSEVICQEATSPALPVVGYDVPFRRLMSRKRLLPWYIAMTPYAREDLVSKGIGVDRIFSIPNGVLVPPEVSRYDFGKIVYVGNLTQGKDWKAFDVLFAAWSQVARCNRNARLTVVGAGDPEEWQRYLRERNCESTVDFVGRVDDPGKYYQFASLFLLPSRVEGLSNALLEAQSWGVPAIVSDIPGNRAVVTDRVNGIVVPVGDAGKLAESILVALSDDELRRQMAINARKHIEQHYDIKVVLKTLVEAYAKVSKH